MESMSISQFKARCLAVLADVKRTGRPILVTKRGEPIAEVVPARPKEKKRKLGCMEGRVEFVGDIVSPVIDLNDIEAYSHPEWVLDPTTRPKTRRRRP
jgi:prevent-host-death family protein